VHDKAVADRCARGRVVLIDDDADILESLRALVDLYGYQSECYSNAEGFLAELARENPVYPGPVCVVSDVRMGDVDGLELLRRVGDRDALPLILISGHSGIREAIDAFRLGVVDFLVKPFEAEALLAAVSRALGISDQRQQNLARRGDLQRRVAKLTPRERTVAIEVARGRMNREIAEDLGISERMVKMHRQKVMEKLQVDHVGDLVRLMDQAGLTGYP
jgi:FixJ family two-component response regulator